VLRKPRNNIASLAVLLQWLLL